jgi:predicted GNAT family N-acyltransferase
MKRITDRLTQRWENCTTHSFFLIGTADIWCGNLLGNISHEPIIICTLRVTDIDTQPEHLWIEALQTRRSHREQGHAGDLLAHALYNLSAKDRDFILAVHSENLPAISLYKKMGFSVDDAELYEPNDLGLIHMRLPKEKVLSSVKSHQKRSLTREKSDNIGI